MISGATTTCFQHNWSHGLQLYGVADHEDQALPSSILEAESSDGSNHSGALLYSLSVLKDKVQQVQSLVSVVVSPDHQAQPDHDHESLTISIAGMGTVIQEIIVTASSMMFTCQQLAFGTAASANANNNNFKVPNQEEGVNVEEQEHGGFFAGESTLHCFASTNNYMTNNESKNIDNINNNIDRNINGVDRVVDQERELVPQAIGNVEELLGFSPWNCDIIELNATDLLAKYTHYCQVCGKGFKRDANLRMHMRAHGNEYKSRAALSNPMKNNNSGGSNNVKKLGNIRNYYSCPQEGCRWNRKHANFQPLKSKISVKNHYKRSHCPKMYVCNRCNQKQFSVLSDLRTHEKHCGDVKWQCSCGTTFSRKDKLMGHLALFFGHAPAGNLPTKHEQHQTLV